MKKIGQLALLFALVLVAQRVSATTYYIDYTNGSDSNSGTSKTSPWQHAPGMTGCTANCANYLKVGRAGDQIILKGCVTWPNAVMPWNWYANDGYPSGTAANPIYIGVDKTWWDSSVAGCSAAWNRPIFNLGGVATNNPSAIVFAFGGASYVILDNFEITGVLCRMGILSGTQVGTTVFFYGASTNLSVKNMFVHGWSSSQPTIFTTATIASGSAILNLGASVDQLLSGVSAPIFVGEPVQILPAGSVLPVISNGPTITAISATSVTVNATAMNGSCASTPCLVQIGCDYCHVTDGESNAGNVGSTFEESVVDGFDTPEVQADPSCITAKCIASGMGVFHGPPIVRNNVFRYLSNGFVGDPQEGSGNLIEYIRISSNPSAHTNAWEDNEDAPQGLLFFNNVVRHLNSATQPANQIGVPVWIAPRADATSPTYIFNNVLYDGISNATLEMGTPLVTAPKAGTTVVFSNTIDGGPSRNLNFSASGCGSNYVNCTFKNNHFITNAAGFTCGSNCTQSNNLTQTPAAANAQGYSLGEVYVYSPTSSAGATVGKGTDVSGFCAAIGAMNSNAGQACESDTTYAVDYSAESCSTLPCWQAASHTVVIPDRAANLRPPSTPDIGAYQFAGSSAPQAPTNLTATVN